MPRDFANKDLLGRILAVLQPSPNHGHAIAREVARLSNQTLHLREGTLYPALRVLEQDGLIVGKWAPQEYKGGDRKVYTLTEAGRKEMLGRRRHIQTA